LARVELLSESADGEMHGSIGKARTETAEEELSANVYERRIFTSGQPEEALAACSHVFKRRFTVPWIHQGYLEPQVAMASPDRDGGVSIYTSTQGTFYTRSVIAGVFDIPPGKVRVEAGTLGGAFGGKIALIEPLVVAAALAAKRPVRVAWTRSEDFAAGNPAPSFDVELTLGLTADGRFGALDAVMVVDTGAFTDNGTASLAAARMPGPYRFQATRVKLRGVRTNRPGAGAYRAPGGPQCAFALESLIDEAAQALGLDPVELRRMNVLATDEIAASGSRTAGHGMDAVLDTVASHPLWQRRDELPADQGIGLAIGMHPGQTMGAAASCRMDPDGGMTIVHGYVDMTGTDATMQVIAAEAMGVAPDLVRVEARDTRTAPPAGLSGGSMVTYCLGSAVKAAALSAREQLLDMAAGELEIAAGDLEVVDGAVRPVGSPAQAIAITSLVAKASGLGNGCLPIEGHGAGHPPELAPSAAAALAHIAVDRETGQVSLIDYVAVQDVGRVLNPALCEGQMRGGAAQAIGMALFEGMEYSDDGELLTGSFLTYAMPRSERLPDMETIIVEVPSEHGAFGARGIGESAIVPGAAAVANAVAAAATRMSDLPMTAGRVWQALRS
jgi:CO/xanthine dehydrogenase Mo-binding subunit